MMKFTYLVLLIFFAGSGLAQIAGLSAVYDDSFVEWTIITMDSTAFEGELNQTFGFDSDTDWSYRIEDWSGDIRMRPGTDGRLWELTSPDGNVSIRRVWPGDNREWVITDDYKSLTIRTRYRNTADEWRLTDEDDGYLDIFSAYEGDPRDWILESDLSADYTVEMRLAALFIVMYTTTR